MVVNLSLLEKEHHFKYTTSLLFDTPLAKTSLEKACLQAPISEEALLYGKRYHEELRAGTEIPSKISWINEEVGYGLYSDSDIPRETFIGEYTGLIGQHRPYYSISNYCFQYPFIKIEPSLSIDAGAYGNFTRFINHSFSPNLKILYAFHQGLYHVILVAAHPIKKGEHLTYNYGHSYWYLRGAPYVFS